MPTFTPALRAVPVALAAVALLAGCNRPKPRSQEAAGPLNATAAAPAAPATPTSAEPVPAQPAWAQADMGKVLKDAYPTESTDCIGNTDAVNLRYTGATPGVRVEGWGWDMKAKAPVAHILLVDDKSGAIVGAGETGGTRPDVPRARPDITSQTTGWTAVTAKTSGGVYAYGLTGGGKSVCRLGHIKL